MTNISQKVKIFTYFFVDKKWFYTFRPFYTKADKNSVFTENPQKEGQNAKK